MDVALSTADEETVEAVEIRIDIGFGSRGQDPRHGASDETDGVDADQGDGGKLLAPRDHGIREDADLRGAAAGLPLASGCGEPPLLKAVGDCVRGAAELVNGGLEFSDVCP
jgi:hypothetical protein